MSQLALLGGPAAIADTREPGWPPLDKAARAAIVDALDAPALYYGAKSITRRFEKRFAEYHGSRYALATDSGTTALLLAFFSAGMCSAAWRGESTSDSEPPEVIVPAYGFFASASPLLHLGVRPVFCDVLDATGNIDPLEVARLISHRTRGVIAIHIAGHPADMNALVDLSARHSIPLIEDGSHAHGARYHGRRVGTMGHAAAFSCQTGKMLSGGEGGVLLTDDDEVLFRASMLGNFRRLEGTALATPEALADTGLGLKLRMSPLSAALADHLLERLDELIEQRRSNLDYLTLGLAQVAGHVLRLPTTAAGVDRGAFYEYPIRYCGSPDVPLEALKMALRAENVHIPNSNTRAIYKLPIFRLGVAGQLAHVWRKSGARTAESSHDGSHFPNANRLDAETFVLPTFTGVPTARLDEYIVAFDKVVTRLDDVADAWRQMSTLA